MSANSVYNFKRIQVVPSGKDFIDIVLSKTQRKTPTVVHKGYPIARIRQFYMRKVRFVQQTIHDKLSQILEDFPKIEDIHPFYADLMNVLYDRDHYKLALGQLSGARHLINNVAKDYEKLLKFGDSLYRCKQLKRAALGRMATLLRRQTSSLTYLEQVRQHLARLPSIDPTARTLLVCGYPNVGKSSFLNKLTRANVEVQPYAFTTKSLFVGHMDYKYVRWQVIDTPGILDHPLEDRNTIEMQSITALAHLRACILYFIDLSEQCGYSIKDQVNLYHSIKPLFVNKPVLLVANKIDVRKYEELNEEEQTLIRAILDDGVELVQASCVTDEGVMQVKKIGCDKLLNLRIELKMKGKKVMDILNKLHVAIPGPRDDKQRPAFIPQEIRNRGLYDKTDLNRRLLERDVELEHGGPGIYSIDLHNHYLLKSDQWKYDVIPEIMDGKNVADFIDPDIEAKLDALEREEELLENQNHYTGDEIMETPERVELRKLSKAIREKKALIIQRHRSSKTKNRPKITKKAIVERIDKSIVERNLSELGYDVNALHERDLKRKRSVSRGRSSVAIDIVSDESRTRPRSVSVNTKRARTESGLKNHDQILNTTKLARKARLQANENARKGEADRKILNLKPRHLFAGKRGIGSNDRR